MLIDMARNLKVMMFEVLPNRGVLPLPDPVAEEPPAEAVMPKPTKVGRSLFNRAPVSSYHNFAI